MENEIIIRAMKPEDLEEVVALEQQTFSMPWTADGFLWGMEQDGAIYLVVEREKEILGYCGASLVLDEGSINNIAVHPKARKQGIGYKLLSQVLEEGQKKGAAVFYLEVRKSNEAAQKLYEKLGFEAVGIRKGFYEHPREDAMIMSVITAGNT